MRKLKFLNVFVIVLIIIYIIHYLTTVYLEFFTNFLDSYKAVSENFVFGYYTQYVGMIISILTFIGLFFIQKGLSTTIKNGFFNQSNATKFKIAGQLFLVSGVLSLIFEALLFYNSQEITFIPKLGQNLLLIIISYSLFIIADIIIKGSLIKQENDLTI